MDAAFKSYLNGQWVDAQVPALPVNDAGFVLGATLSDRLRTFGGRLFELDRHLDRLERSLAIIGVPLPEPREQIARIADELVRYNAIALHPGSDQGMVIFVTPGSYATLAAGAPSRPTLCLHSYPLPFALWSDAYRHGQSLMATEVRQVPSVCWPASIKCRSRMHYYLADREAAMREPGARALLQDLDGYVSETSTANVLGWFDREGLVSPPWDLILPGVSLAVTSELAASLGIRYSERPLTIPELQTADEVLVTSTPYCILPVTRLNGKPIAGGRPGDTFRRLLAAWNDRVGIDIAGQAARFDDPRM